MVTAEWRDGQEPLLTDSGTTAATHASGGRTHLWCVCASAPAYQVDKQAISSSVLQVPIKLIAYCDTVPEFLAHTPMQPILDSLLPTTQAGDTTAVLLHVLLHQQSQLLTSQAVLVPLEMLASQQSGDHPLELDVCVQATGDLLMVPTILTCQVCAFLPTTHTAQQPMLLACCKLPIMPMGGSAHELCTLYSCMLSQYKQLAANSADPLQHSSSSATTTSNTSQALSSGPPAWQASDHVVMSMHCYEPLLHNMEQLLCADTRSAVNQAAIAQVVQYLTEQGLAKTLACMLMRMVNAGGVPHPEGGQAAGPSRHNPSYPVPRLPVAPVAAAEPHWPDPRPRARQGGAHRAQTWMAGHGPSRASAGGHQEVEPPAVTRTSASAPTPEATVENDLSLFSLSRENCEVLLEVLKTHSSTHTAVETCSSLPPAHQSTSENFRSLSRPMASRKSTGLAGDNTDADSHVPSIESRPHSQVFLVYEGLASSDRLGPQPHAEAATPTQPADLLFQPWTRTSVKLHVTPPAPPAPSAQRTTGAPSAGPTRDVKPVVAPAAGGMPVCSSSVAAELCSQGSVLNSAGTVPGTASLRSTSHYNLHLHTISDASVSMSAEMLMLAGVELGPPASIAYNTWHPERTSLIKPTVKVISKSAPTTKETIRVPEQALDSICLVNRINTQPLTATAPDLAATAKYSRQSSASPVIQGSRDACREHVSPRACAGSSSCVPASMQLDTADLMVAVQSPRTAPLPAAGSPNRHLSWQPPAAVASPTSSLPTGQLKLQQQETPLRAPATARPPVYTRVSTHGEDLVRGIEMLEPTPAVTQWSHGVDSVRRFASDLGHAPLSCLTALNTQPRSQASVMCTERCSWPGTLPADKVCHEDTWPETSVSNAATMQSTWSQDEFNSSSTIRALSTNDQLPELIAAHHAAAGHTTTTVYSSPPPARDQPAVAQDQLLHSAMLQGGVVLAAMLVTMAFFSVSGKVVMCVVTSFDQALAALLLPYLLRWASSCVPGARHRHEAHAAVASTSLRTAVWSLLMWAVRGGGAGGSRAGLVAIGVGALGAGLLTLPTPDASPTVQPSNKLCLLLSVLNTCSQLVHIAGAGVAHALVTASITVLCSHVLARGVGEPHVAPHSSA